MINSVWANVPIFKEVLEKGEQGRLMFGPIKRSYVTVSHDGFICSSLWFHWLLRQWRAAMLIDDVDTLNFESVTHILWLEDVADHPVQPSVVLGHGGLLSGVLQVVLCAAGSNHLPPGHQHHHVPDVGYVGDRPQWQVHYRLLVAKKKTWGTLNESQRKWIEVTVNLPPNVSVFFEWQVMTRYWETHSLMRFRTCYMFLSHLRKSKL